MARTAPVPNIPAIPGMNPGTWVALGVTHDRREVLAFDIAALGWARALR